MKILMVTPELTPYVKVGGLADVVGVLPKQLKAMGHDVRVLCPLYGGIWYGGEGWWGYNDPLVVHTGDGHRYGKIWETRLPGSEAVGYFLEHSDYFDRHEVYTGPWGSHKDNPDRFTFLSRAAIDLCHYLNWYPDIIHAHDWPTALVPVMLNANRSDNFGGTASVLTIHNLEHQGYCDRYFMYQGSIPQSEFRDNSLECFGNINMLKGGIYHANKITTVSPTYANEIQGHVGGCGLHDVLRFKSGDLVGILNGIDMNAWNPQTDPFIPANYSVDDLSGKAVCKAELQRRFCLHEDPTIPVFGVVARFARQKGLDILRDVVGPIVDNMRVQFAILGSGEDDLEWSFGEIPKHFGGRIGSYIGFNNELAHLIEAGSDFFVMPSRFEPCGLNQMYSMRYGTLPVARATGGLVDSIEQYQEGQDKGTGFLFNDPMPHALYYTVGWACATYYDRPQEYRAMQNRAMKKNFSWEQSAEQYVNVYKWALEKVGR